MSGKWSHLGSMSAHLPLSKHYLVHKFASEVNSPYVILLHIKQPAKLSCAIISSRSVSVECVQGG